MNCQSVLSQNFIEPGPSNAQPSRIMTFDDSIQTHSHFASPFTVIWKKFCSCAQMVKLAYEDFLSNMAFNILLVSNVAEAC